MLGSWHVVTPSWAAVVVVVEAVVVTALVYALGIAVTDPVPVVGTLTLCTVWVVTKLPAGDCEMPASGLCCTGLVTADPVVDTASVLISSVEGIAWRELAILSKDATFVTPSLFTCNEGILVMPWVCTCSDGTLAVPSNWTVSGEFVTLSGSTSSVVVLQVLSDCTFKDVTFSGGKLFTSRVAVVRVVPLEG